jgi:hypothetical protein
MFLITVPSLSKHVHSLISDITENQKDRIDKDEVQYKLVLGEENKKESENIKAILSSVVTEILHVLSGSSSLSPKAVPSVLSSANLKLGGSICLRHYPTTSPSSPSPQRLGPHCDGNFITLLWSTSPGLQVPKNNGCITPSQINSTGTPTLSVPTEPRREMEDEDWDTVEVTGEDDVVVTIGVDWIRRDLYKGINEVSENIYYFTTGGGDDS